MRPRFVRGGIQNQIQMTTPHKVVQSAGIVQQSPRFQTPVRATRAQNPVRNVRPRTPSARAKTPVNVRPVNNQQQQTVTVVNNTNTPRPRIAMNRLTGPNQMTQLVQPVISVGTQKQVASITPPSKVANIVRTPVSMNFNKTSPATQVQLQSSPSTSNTSIATEDLEDSIQAATITKQPTVQQQTNYTNVQANQQVQMQRQINEANDNQIVTLQGGTQITVGEYKQRHGLQGLQGVTKQLAGIRPMNRQLVVNRQPARFASPNTVRVQRPVMVGSNIIGFLPLFLYEFNLNSHLYRTAGTANQSTCN